MPTYSPNDLDKVRSANDIVDVIGAAVPLKKAGVNFVCLCPFHREKSPSFNVNPGKQIFRCFGCGKGGDVFTFIQEYEGLSFVESVQRLAERANIVLEVDNTGGAAQQRSVKDSLLKLHEAICLRWQQCLANEAAGQIARDYLAKRGVPAEAISEFRIGAAPEAWDDTVNWAKGKGFDLGLAEMAGLVVKRDTGGYYDRFRGRLMFPICDEQGRVIAFSGRILQGDEKQAKYVNSPETPLFTKGKVLFALHRAKRPILDIGYALICEGQLDTIACHMGGVTHAVAPQGTALTADHARILKRYVNEVVLCFDGDKAGRNATVRALDDLLASGLAVKVASIPPPDDPDSYIKQFGADAFRQILARAQGFFDFYLQHLMAENEATSDKGRMTIVRSMSEAVLKTGNAVLIDTYAQRTAQRLGVDPGAVRKEFRTIGPARSARTSSEDPLVETLPQTPLDPREYFVLKVTLQVDEVVPWVVAHLDPEWIGSPLIRDIIARRIQGYMENTWNGIPSLLAGMEDPILRTLVLDAATRPLIHDSGQHLKEIREPLVELNQTVQRLRDSAVDRQLVSLNARLADPALLDEERVATIHDQMRLRAQKKQPLVPLAGHE
ncbi:MAG TPA: DNA primase [Candidatus Limnocylindria bacterium]|jgi:DNA primase|nr:DNA primase [Candidatus Limnocylindria bacterium]